MRKHKAEMSRRENEWKQMEEEHVCCTAEIKRVRTIINMFFYSLRFNVLYQCAVDWLYLFKLTELSH